MKTEGSITALTTVATYPHPQPDQSSPSTPLHLLKNHSNIILPNMSRYSKRPFSLRFSHQTLYTPLLSPIRSTCPSHLILLNLITRIIFYWEYWLINSSLCNLLHSPVTSLLLGAIIFLSILFPQSLSLGFSLFSSLNVTEEISF